MNLIQMAGHLSLEFGASVDGPYGTDEHHTVRVFLDNGRGVSLTHVADRDEPGTAELLVLREVFDGCNDAEDVFIHIHDYSTPVTSDVRPSQGIDDVRAALSVLRDMPASDRYDMRTGRSE